MASKNSNHVMNVLVANGLQKSCDVCYTSQTVFLGKVQKSYGKSYRASNSVPVHTTSASSQISGT